MQLFKINNFEKTNFYFFEEYMFSTTKAILNWNLDNGINKDSINEINNILELNKSKCIEILEPALLNFEEINQRQTELRVK